MIMYLDWAWTLDVIGVFLVILRFPFTQLPLTRPAIKLFRLEDLAILNVFKRASTKSKYTERLADGKPTIN